MANKKQQKPTSVPVPNARDSGTTQQASDRTSRPGGPEHTELDDRYAAGTPGGGSEFGGLAGSNEGDGSPEEANLEEVMGSGIHEPEAEGDAPYGGFTGGAVGGTPAQGRSSGGKIRGGLTPGGTHRGDSTIGSEPSSEDSTQ
jgi:hypothetical protein